jgi:hypothetical protein
MDELLYFAARLARFIVLVRAERPPARTRSVRANGADHEPQRISGFDGRAHHQARSQAVRYGSTSPLALCRTSRA